MQNIDVSFITINYNSSQHTCKLIESIQRFTSINYEIIVVDNASNEDDFSSLQKCLSSYNNTQLIKNRINSGFAGGNMLGVNYANGEYYLFINNDTILLNDIASIMKNFLDNNKNVSLATSEILDEKSNSFSSHTLFPSIKKELLGKGFARKFNNFPSNKIRLTEPTKVEVVSGSCMFFRASSFSEIGGLDTNFFLYCEEEDISKRIWENKNEVYFLPEAKITHYNGGSTEKSVDILKEFNIPYKHLIFKHFNLFSAYILMLLVTIKLLRRSFTKKDGYKLFLFALKGFPKKESLRYKQKLKTYNE